jgi:citronellol/citronellal dehydrogenase
MRLEDKVAIVTGSSRGIGKAIAKGFAAEGAHIVVAARTEVEDAKRPGTIYSTAAEIKALGRRALAVKCDVTSEQSVNDMVQKVVWEFGHIDILVNNAGVVYTSPVLETSLKRWELILRVNSISAFICVKAVLPKMIEQNRGSIINISSVDATLRGPSPTGIAYGVAKAGLERFTWGLAVEVGKHNIAVNALKPRGAVDTEGIRSVVPKVELQLDSPENMVKAAIFLATQDATGTTGVVATDEELCTWHGLV